MGKRLRPITTSRVLVSSIHPTISDEVMMVAMLRAIENAIDNVYPGKHHIEIKRINHGDGGDYAGYQCTISVEPKDGE